MKPYGRLIAALLIVVFVVALPATSISSITAGPSAKVENSEDGVTGYAMPSGTTLQATGEIQTAIDNAPPGTTIRLLAKKYYDNVNVDKDLNIIGRGMGYTIVNGQKLGSVFTIDPGVTATLSDMTIKKGQAAFGGGGVDNYGTLTLKVGVITNEVRGPSCGPYNAVPSQSGFGYVGSVTVTPIDITNKIPKGIHTISSSDIDSEHALTLEAVTSPSEKSMVLYDKPKTIWVEDKIESKSLSDLYSLIRPMLSMPLNSSESMSKDVTTAISKATGTTMGNLNNPFIVNANESCIDTGIMVSQGDSIQFLAIGQATYGFEGSPIDNTPVTNPDGDRSVNNINIGKKLDSNNINPSAPTGSLVGKVGWNGNYFYIGSGNQLTMPASGNIILCYNDVEGNYIDNGGYYRVDIYRK